MHSCVVSFTGKINNDFVNKSKQLLQKYPNIDVTAMGFPKDWEMEPLWKA